MRIPEAELSDSRMIGDPFRRGMLAIPKDEIGTGRREPRRHMRALTVRGRNGDVRRKTRMNSAIAVPKTSPPLVALQPELRWRADCRRAADKAAHLP